MTIPEHGHIRIPVQTAPMGGVQIDGIESLPQPHRRSRLSCIRGALVKKTGRLVSYCKVGAASFPRTLGQLRLLFGRNGHNMLTLSLQIR
jgi:hypothetical protein